jgi:predicted  nucleic acid-binding Zn-ribbon protein
MMLKQATGTARDAGDSAQETDSESRDVEIADLLSKLQEAERKQAECEEDMASLRKQVSQHTDLEADVEGLTKQLNESREREARMRDQMDVGSSKRAELAEALAQAQNELGSTQAAHAACGDTIAGLKSELEARADELQSAHAASASSEKRIAELESLSTRQGHQISAAEALREENESLQAQTSGLEASISSLQCQLQEERDRAHECEEALKGKYEKLSSEASEWSQRANVLEDRLGQITAENAEFAKKSEQLRNDVAVQNEALAADANMLCREIAHAVESMHQVTSSCEEIRAIASEQESLQQEMQVVREVRSNLLCHDFEKIGVIELVRGVAKKV